MPAPTTTPLTPPRFDHRPPLDRDIGYGSLGGYKQRQAQIEENNNYYKRRSPLQEGMDSYRHQLQEGGDNYRRPLQDGRESYRRPLLEGGDSYRRPLQDGGDSYRRNSPLEDSGSNYSYKKNSSRDDLFKRQAPLEDGIPSYRRQSPQLEDNMPSYRKQFTTDDNYSAYSRKQSGSDGSQSAYKRPMPMEENSTTYKRQTPLDDNRGPPSLSGYKNRQTPMDDSSSRIFGQRKRSSMEDLSNRNFSADLDADDERRLKSLSALNRKKANKKRRNPITANISGTRYDVVRQMMEQAGFTISRDEDNTSYLFWNDSFVSTERISELKSYQRINHFPGMGEVCRKDCLARNMTKMAKVHPEEFSFIPRTWIFPSEYSGFQNYARELKKKKKSKTFIAKPANGAMGNGISLYRNAEKIPQTDHIIVQEYIDKPFTVESFKCDMRIYVLVTSCDPLRIFLYNDGLLRMSTEKYIQPTDHNIEHLFMHLTNYSVNKHNENYEKSGHIDTGSKRSLKFFNEYLRKHDYDVGFLWKNITDLIIKTLIVAQPHILHAYRMCRPGQAASADSVCFEVLGFDIMVDKKLRPWLLEINRSPSFGTDEKLDYDIKSGVIEDTIRLLNIKASDKRKNLAAQKAQAQRRLMRPAKRVDGEVSELEKKRQSVERKKEELKDMLTRIRRDAAKEDFENRNCGRFTRIFPPDDKYRREKFATLLADAFGVFLSGRAGSLQQEIKKTYNNKLREEDVLDMLAQCEADEKDGKSITSNRPVRGPKPLSSMPTVARETEDEDMECDDMDEDGAQRGRTGRSTSSSPWRGGGSRPGSGARPTSKTAQHRSRSLTRPTSSSNRLPSKVLCDDILLSATAKEKEEDSTRRTLVALNDMRIKFPGKTDEEADYILDKLHENWKFHKPRIASYWLVKLDSIKRRKVIDIVRSNVRAVLQRTWKTSDVDSLRLYRIFNRVFNRLLWSHGQGLWNCFSTQGNSWETIFSKSTDVITPSEMNCCRRIVQLCRDCLLIVYQFAADAKSAASHNPMAEADSTSRASRANGNTEKNIWNPSHSVSQRIARLYQSRAETINGTS